MNQIQYIDSLDDPRVAIYRNLKERDVARTPGSDGISRFIAEGELVVRRLLESDYMVESVLLAQRRADEIAPMAPDDVQVYVVPDPLMQHVVGFKFHSGVIACGRRKRRATLEEVVNRLNERATVVVCPEIANTENLGAMIRLAAGFGADAMILGEQCCDPFYRQSIRVSMGSIFQLSLLRSSDLSRDLQRIKHENDFELIATVLDESAEPLASARREKKRLALLFGNEAQGLSPELISLCDRRITIPMKLGTDSLNVAIAASVFLYHFTMLKD